MMGIVSQDVRGSGLIKFHSVSTAGNFWYIFSGLYELMEMDCLDIQIDLLIVNTGCGLRMLKGAQKSLGAWEKSEEEKKQNNINASTECLLHRKMRFSWIKIRKSSTQRFERFPEEER